jgi:hypothetical protein
METISVDKWVHGIVLSGGKVFQKKITKKWKKMSIQMLKFVFYTVNRHKLLS